METLSLAATATLTHGWTLADVDRAASLAYRKHPFVHGVLDRDDGYDTAWHGVVEQLYVCGCGFDACTRVDNLTFHDLLMAGARALDRAISSERTVHGRDGAGGESPNFAKFWLPVRRAEQITSDGFSDSLCDRLVIRDLLFELTPEQYVAVATLAAFDNAGKPAAEALGMKHSTFCDRISRARARARTIWTEECPAPQKTVDCCGRGHARAKYGYQRIEGGYTRWGCYECNRITGRERKARSVGRARAQARIDREAGTTA